jgi:hypothetical protein
MQPMFASSPRKLTLKKKREKSNYVCIKLGNTLLIHGYGTHSFGAQTRVHLPFVTRNLQALDRAIRTIGELCARRLDRISRLNVRRQGDRGFGLHSARVGKYIDVSVLLLPKSVVATRVRRWCTGEATLLCYHNHT